MTDEGMMMMIIKIIIKKSIPEFCLHRARGSRYAMLCLYVLVEQSYL